MMLDESYKLRTTGAKDNAQQRQPWHKGTKQELQTWDEGYAMKEQSMSEEIHHLINIIKVDL